MTDHGRFSRFKPETPKFPQGSDIVVMPCCTTKLLAGEIKGTQSGGLVLKS